MTQKARAGRTSSHALDDHLCLVDLRPDGLDGIRVETLLKCISVTCNNSMCPGDENVLTPGGIRLGSPALTSRNLKEADFRTVADFVSEGIQLAKKNVQKSKNCLDFKQFCETDEEFKKDAAELRQRVESFARKFSIPGFEDC